MMEDEKVSENATPPGASSADHCSEVDNVSEATPSNLEKLMFLAELNIDGLQQKTSSVPEGPRKYVPGQHPKTRVSLKEIRERLLSIIIQGEEEEEEDTAIICNRKGVTFLEEVHKISLVSHTMAAYIGTYEENLVRRIALQIMAETTLWINRMFRFFDSSAYFHSDMKQGLVKIVQLVLHTHYPKYSNHGYEALYTRPPVIYYNGLCMPGLEQYLSTELGLPTSCFTSIPANCLGSASCKMDTAALEKLILEDQAAGRTPLMVLASAGSSLLGVVDDLLRLNELCHAHKMWCHVSGHALANLCLEPVTKAPFDLADSMTICLGKWIGIPNLASVTLYKIPETAHIHTSALGQQSAPHTLLESVLPLWVTIQALGYENIAQRIKHCLNLTDYLVHQIMSYNGFHIIGKEELETHENPSEGAAATENTNDKVPFCDVHSVVVFQYVQQFESEQERTNHRTERNSPYFDNLNSWLVQLLSRNIPGIRTDILDLDNFGVCLRVCFLESAYVMNSTKKDIDYYCSCLQHQLGILNATVKQRGLMYSNHTNHRKLKLVEIKDWAGMGGARYIPEIWADRLNELTDTGKEDINSLNSELVAKLKATDSAFSIGEADDGMLCVRFGMVDEHLNLEELISLVISAGQEIEDSSKFLETMAEMVKHGIEEANKELVQENQEKLMQEGLLKQVPVIGSLVSWWFPTQNETGIKGRSFDLSSGTIESTENIYKYHMQIKEGGLQTPPPATKVLISPSQANSEETKEKQNDISAKK